MFDSLKKIALFGLAVSGVFAQTSTPVPTPYGVTYTTGLVGIVPGQTARMNILDAATPALTTNPVSACYVAVTYYNAAGTLLKTSTVAVTPGTANHVDLIPAATPVAVTANQPADIRAAFSLLAVPVAGSATTIVAPVCNLVATLEIFDEITGKISIVMDGIHQVESATTTTAAIVKP